MKSYSIGTRLALAMAAVLTLTMLLSGAYIYAIHALDVTFDRTADRTVQKVSLGGELDAIKSDMFLAQRGLVLSAFLGDGQGMQQEREQFQTLTVQFRRKLEALTPIIETSEGRALVATMSQKADDWVREFAEVDRLVNAGDPYSAQKYSIAKISPIYQDLGAAADGFVRTAKGVLEHDRAGENAVVARSMWLASILSLMTVACVIFVFFMTRGLNAHLRNAVAKLSNSADQVMAAASQVSSSSQQLAQGASQEAAALEETSSSSNEVGSMSRQNATSSREAAQVTGDVNQRVTEAN